MADGNRYRTLAEAVNFALTRGGADVMDNPGQFLSYIADVTDPDSVEMRVLMRLCDRELLEPYRESRGKGLEALYAAEARARDYLVNECQIQPRTAAAVSGGIAAGIARKDGLVSGARTGQSQRPQQPQQPQRPQTPAQSWRDSRGSAGSTGEYSQTLLVTPPIGSSAGATTRRPPSQGQNQQPPTRQTGARQTQGSNSQGRSQSSANKPVDIAGATVKVDSQRFTGKPITPKPTVTLQGKTLIYGRDFLLNYHSNQGSQTRESEATVIVIGTGEYTGSRVATFKILPPDEPKTTTAEPKKQAGKPADKPTIDIATAFVSNVPSQRYTGRSITPKLQIVIGGKQLVEGTDYRRSYFNNVGDSKTATEARIEIEGIGRYSGKKTVKFTIEPAQGQQPSSNSGCLGPLTSFIGVILFLVGIVLLCYRVDTGGTDGFGADPNANSWQIPLFIIGGLMLIFSFNGKSKKP